EIAPPLFDGIVPRINEGHGVLVMYDKFYRLSTLPFQLIPDAQFFFESTVHRQAMAYLTYGIRHAGGFIVITGDRGRENNPCGPSVICVRQYQVRRRENSNYSAGWR